MHAQRRIPVRDLSWNSLKRSPQFIVGLALFVVAGLGGLLLLLAADTVDYSAWTVCGLGLLVAVIDLVTRIGAKKKAQQLRERHKEREQAQRERGGE